MDTYEERPNHFNNRSGPAGDINPGNRGKFSESQIADRYRVHAIALARGGTTIQQIVDHWKEKYGIDISTQSEKEWRKSNIEKIQKKKMEMINKGDILIPEVGEEVLNNSMLDLTISTTQLSAKLRQKVQNLVHSLDFSKIGESPEEDKTITQKVKFIKSLAGDLSLLNGDISEQIETMFRMAGKIKIKDKNIEKVIAERVNERVGTLQEDDLPKEISDEDRSKFLED